MKIVIDTSSLLSLVRYYLHFDKNNILFDFIEAKIKTGEILILNEVYNECMYTAKGIVIEKLNYLEDKKLHVKTTSLIPTKKYFNLLENQLCNHVAKKKLTDTEFENQKNDYLKSADAKIILYCLNYKANLLDNKIIVVSEETTANNDNKAFKKIPTICEILKMEYNTLPMLLEKYADIDIEFRKT